MAASQTTSKKKAPAKKSDGPAHRKKEDEVLNYRPGAKFISAGGQEYFIKVSDDNFYVIGAFRSGVIPPQISSRYTSVVLAEEALISYLRHSDRLSYARYPGKQSAHGPFNGE